MQHPREVFSLVGAPQHDLAPQRNVEQVLARDLRSLGHLQYKECHRKAITAMVEKLSQRGRRPSSPCLLPVDRIQCLVNEDADSVEKENPPRDGVVQRGVVD